MGQREYPEGHPASSDYDPASQAAKDYLAAHPPTPAAREWPVGSPLASDAQAPKSGTGWKATLVASVCDLRAGQLALTPEHTLVALCPLHSDRAEMDLTTHPFDQERVSITGAFELPCKKVASVSEGVWRLE